jgi:hypothetical protein
MKMFVSTAAIDAVSTAAPALAGNQSDERCSPTTNTSSGDVFSHVCSIERPLAVIRNFLNALAMISETLDEPGASAVNQITWAMMDQVADLNAEHVTLFRLTHPGRERFEREGWPGDAEQCA